MKILLHICCGPCAIEPVQELEAEGFEVEGFFYNPNIHPYSEYQKRVDAVLSVGKKLRLAIIHHRYDFEDFLKNLAGLKNRNEQHAFCWKKRLEETARVAAQEGIKNFTTTLLSSPYQDVETIKKLGDEVALTFGVTFLARNFRQGFQKSHQVSKEWGLYHQNYCGCLYSEKESIEQRERRKVGQR